MTRFNYRLTWWKGLLLAVVLAAILLVLAIAFNLATGIDSDQARWDLQELAALLS